MDYHSDQFIDHSLLVLDDQDKLLASLPANITERNVLVSHQGLTYGGIIYQQAAKLSFCIEVVYHLLKYLHSAGIHQFILKQFPAFFNKSATDEIEYILFLLDATLYRRDVAFVIDHANYIPCTGNIRREGIKAERKGVQLIEDDCPDEFWEKVLVPNLKERFGVAPVHTLQEIKLLKERFPDHIRQYNAVLDGQIMAGTTLFLTPEVAHCQYISATNAGRANGSLNFLFKELIDKVLVQHHYFDFGIVNEKEGRDINQGMLFWKESFGGRARRQDFYSINPAAYQKLEKFIK